MVFLGIVMMPFYYGSKARSVPEFLRKRFNRTTQRVRRVMFALASVLIAGVNLYALGLVLEALLGWPLAVAIPVAALVVLSYTFLGGLSAAIYNEVLQFFVILALLIPLTVAGLARVGGWAGLKEKVTAVPGGPEQLSSWPGTSLTEIANPFLSVLGIVFGLGFVLSFGYWTTNFAEVQRALSAKNMSAARRTPIIGGVPQGAHPAGHRHPRHDRRRAGPAAHHARRRAAPTDVTYNNALSLLMNEVLPNGMLGVALAGLLAAFMAGMAANVSSLNTVFTYDIWQDWIRPGRDDRYYLQVGRAVTVIGVRAGHRHGVHRRQLLEPDGLHPGAVQLLQRPAVRDLHPRPVLEADDRHGRLDRAGLRRRIAAIARRRAGPRRRHRRVVAGRQLHRRERGVRRRVSRWPSSSRSSPPPKPDAELVGLTWSLDATRTRGAGTGAAEGTAGGSRP